jgi:hypothetical protein
LKLITNLQLIDLLTCWLVLKFVKADMPLVFYSELSETRTCSTGVALCFTFELFIKEVQENEERDSTEKITVGGFGIY